MNLGTAGSSGDPGCHPEPAQLRSGCVRRAGPRQEEGGCQRRMGSGLFFLRAEASSTLSRIPPLGLNVKQQEKRNIAPGGTEASLLTRPQSAGQVVLPPAIPRPSPCRGHPNSQVPLLSALTSRPFQPRRGGPERRAGGRRRGGD